jgi:hypothetical protein
MLLTSRLMRAEFTFTLPKNCVGGLSEGAAALGVLARC